MTVTKKYSKERIATGIAILFHVVGLVGILVFKSELITRSTPMNLLLSFSLLIWTQEKNRYFWIFAVLAFVTGFVVEVIGVNTGALFGNYQYGTVLGIQWKAVPLLIGVNWFIVIYCCGVAITRLLEKMIPAATTVDKTPALKALSVIVDGATLAVVFDWLIEPIAVKLGYWQWQDGIIPFYNYACWFAVSILLMSLFHFLPFNKRNKFAVNLLLIQVMFFLIMRTFLPSLQ